MKSTGECNDVGCVEMHDQVPPERPNALEGVVEHVQIRHPAQVIDEIVVCPKSVDSLGLSFH